MLMIRLREYQALIKVELTIIMVLDGAVHIMDHSISMYMIVEELGLIFLSIAEGALM